MKILVTYKSKTDFTKKYAEMIAKEVDGCLVEFKKMTAEKMSEFDVVVYGGGLYAGMVNGLKKAKEMFEKSFAKKFIVFATGQRLRGPHYPLPPPDRRGIQPFQWDSAAVLLPVLFQTLFSSLPFNSESYYVSL